MKVKEFIELVLKFIVLFVFVICFISYSDELVRIFIYIYSYGWDERGAGVFIFKKIIPLFILLIYMIVFWNLSSWICNKLFYYNENNNFEINLNKIFFLDNLIAFLGVFMVFKSSFVIWRGVTIVYLNTSAIDVGERIIYLYIYGSIALFYLIVGLLIVKKKDFISKFFLNFKS